MATALRESAARLRAIFRTAVEGIVTIDERGIIDTVNPAAERIFGYRAPDLVGRNVCCLMPAPDNERHDGYIRHYLRTGRARIIGIGREVVGRRKDGSLFPMDLSISEVKLGRRRLFTGFIRDISDRKRLEQEILHIAEREQRRIGHDLHDGLGQQLTGIELMCQVLEKKLLGQNRDEAARAGGIAANVRSAIAHTRSLARGLSPVEMDARGLMSALEDLAGSVAAMSHIECVFRCDRPVRVNNHVTATHLFRIAQEALSNAVKHGRARRVRLELVPGREQLELVVRDDGRGFKADATRRKGMGLRLMKYRLGMMGGTLSIQSSAREGTTITAAVPRKALGATTPS